MANICKASTESDKHQLAEIPRNLGTLIPSCLRTEHDFVFSGAFSTNGGIQDATIRFPNRMDGASFEFLRLNLNNPFVPISGYFIWSSNNSPSVVGFSSNKDEIFRSYGTVFGAKGLEIYRPLFKYWKVEASEWVLDFMNITALNDEEPAIPVRLYSYHEDNDTTVLGLTYNGPSEDGNGISAGDRCRIVSLLTHPRVKPLCGGTPLGIMGISGGSSGILSAPVSLPYPPELRTAFRWTNEVASDPNEDKNVKFWTPTAITGSYPEAQTVNQLRVFAVPHGGTEFGSDHGYFRPVVRVRARFTVSWRDHWPSDNMFTKVTNVDNNNYVP